MNLFIQFDIQVSARKLDIFILYGLMHIKNVLKNPSKSDLKIRIGGRFASPSLLGAANVDKSSCSTLKTICLPNTL